MENIMHGGPGPDAIGPFTIFTWGNGAALEAAARIHDGYGEVYLDVRRKQAFGLDGCSAHIEGDTLHVRDNYVRDTLTVVTSDGRRHKVTLREKQAAVTLSSLGKRGKE
jgi:hypothetical protein